MVAFIIGIVFILILLLIIYISSSITSNHSINIIVDFLSKDDKVLDLGCGNCCLSKRLINLGYNITSVDIKNHSTCMTPMIISENKLPFEDKSFDVVLCLFTLHHITNYKEKLKDIARITKKYIIIFEDTPSNWFDEKLASIHIDSKSKWGEGQILTEKSWMDNFKELGFTIANKIPIERYIRPFSDRPYLYPISKTVFVIIPSN